MNLSFSLVGMSTANMKLVVLRVPLQEGNTDENGRPVSPKQKLEDGEHIVRRVVELGKLRRELDGMFYFNFDNHPRILSMF